MHVDKSSISSVQQALDQTTRHFDGERMKLIEQPLQGSDKQDPKLKAARYWLLRLWYLKRRAREHGVEFSENKNALFHHPA